VATYRLTTAPALLNPYRGCPFSDPGHGWDAGRAQRDGGFLAAGSDNDEFALGYYVADDLPLYTALTRRFTLLDRYHCSLLGPTFPNREYLHSVQERTGYRLP
jgi:phospholipase C